MKTIYLTLILILPYAISAEAQQSGKDIAGYYYLSGVMETASGFRLNADSTFQFFFSVGALDRTGQGKWSVSGNTVILNSLGPPEKSFALVDQKNVPSNFITLKISDKNTGLLSYTQFTISGTKGKTVLMANDKGLAKFSKQHIQSISLLLDFCPDKPAIFDVKNSKYNYYEFEFQESILEFFFKDFVLTIEKDKLKGKNPLLDNKTYEYFKD